MIGRIFDTFHELGDSEAVMHMLRLPQGRNQTGKLEYRVDAFGKWIKLHLYDIAKKVALITGANRGIGLATVESFLKHGVTRIYAGVRSKDKADKLVQAHGDRIVPIEIDYEKPDSIRAAAETASDVEVVVSSAGVLIGAEVMADDVIEKFQKELDVNVYGLLHMAHAFAPVLKANGGGA